MYTNSWNSFSSSFSGCGVALDADLSQLFQIQKVLDSLQGYLWNYCRTSLKDRQKQTSPFYIRTAAAKFVREDSSLAVNRYDMESTAICFGFQLRSDSFDPQSTLKRKRSLTLNERRSPARERRIYRSLGRRWSLRESRSGPLRTVSRNRNPSIKSDTMLSLIKRAGNEASHTNNGADAGDSPRRPPQKSRESPNRSARQFKEDFRRSLNNLLNTEAQIGARKHEAEVVERNSVLPPSASAHTIQAQMHHAEALGSVSGTRGTHDPLHPSENARKTSVKSVRKLSDPSVPGRVSENEKRISHTPVDTIVIIVHSVYFVEGGQIINDPRSGEIFVVFRLLDMEYESPLAVVKSAVPHKEMIFEFHKGVYVQFETAGWYC